MLEIENQGGPLSEDDITALETQLDAVLPAEYRQFLLGFNGGVPSPDTVRIEDFAGSEADVQVFFRIGGIVESSDLIWNKAMFAERVPDRMLPVACDSGGNVFCLSLSDPDTGAVVYVDLESPELTRYAVAETFGGFLEKLFKSDEGK